VASYITLNYLDLALASVLVLIDAGLSIIFGLKIHRSLLVAAIRMAAQLTLIGLVLTALFSVVSPLWTGLAVAAMILLAGQEVMQRQDRRLSGWWSFGLGTGCMMMSSVLVTAFALLTAIRPSPWYDPRYAIPLLGMILGNCMTGIALGLNTLTTSLALRRPCVEAQLMLGGHAMGGRGSCNARCAAQCADADHQFHVRYRSGVSPRDDDGADPQRSTTCRGGQIPDPGHVPDCGRYRFWSSGRGTRRCLPPDRCAAPASPRSLGGGASYLDDTR
jgi:hypothetical protein